MNRLAKRIARNGFLAALILAVIGLGFAGIASLYMTIQAGRGSAGEAETAEALLYRFPLGMAGWGFAVVVLVEIGLFLLRGHPAEPAPRPLSAEPKPDTAEILLEQLLREAEAKQQTLTSPSPSDGENSPIPG